MLTSLIYTFESRYIISPIGAATDTARSSTATTLDVTEWNTDLKNSGLRYGGNSIVNEDFSPLRIVFDRSAVTGKVMSIPKSTNKNTIRLTKNDGLFPDTIMKATLHILASIGSLPLQGIKLFVRMARIRSLFESIILDPEIPTALHPSPIHIVSACFPQAPEQANGRSRLYATLGR